MEKIGTIIRRYRIAKGLTQEELGKRVFVSKQAVSKWETGRAHPDIEMVRQLCEILEIDKDEIIGGSITETKKSKKWAKILAAFAILSILMALFFAFDGVGFIHRRTQSSVAYTVVSFNGEILHADEYKIDGNFEFLNYKNGYKFDIDYGEIRAIVTLYNLYEIEFGFVNTNNWHNIQIRLDVTDGDGQIYVKQTISYETDDQVYQILENEITTGDHKMSLFIKGIA